MENIFSYVDVLNIAGVHIKMDKSKEKVINVHIEDRKIVHFKECVEGPFYTNLNDATMITNPINVYINAYYYLSMVKQIS